MPDMMLVPKVATEFMAGAGAERIILQYAESDWEEAKEMAESLDERQIYAAMTAASPNGGKVTREMLREAGQSALANYGEATGWGCDHEAAMGSALASFLAALGLQIEGE